MILSQLSADHMSFSKDPSFGPFISKANQPFHYGLQCVASHPDTRMLFLNGKFLLKNLERFCLHHIFLFKVYDKLKRITKHYRRFVIVDNYSFTLLLCLVKMLFVSKFSQAPSSPPIFKIITW